MMNKPSESEITELRELILSTGKKIVILAHQNPDGDALGSSLGLYHILKNINQTTIVLPNEFPEFLAWMPDADKIVIASQDELIAIGNISTADIIIMTDFNDIKRINHLADAFIKSSAVKILIDHHPYPNIDYDYAWTDITVSSASEIVYEVIQTIVPHLFNHNSAVSIFTGMLMDTGTFTFNSGKPRTFEIVAELLKYGVDKEKITSLVYDNFSDHRMRLMGYCLNNKMVVLHRHGSAFISLTKKEMKQYNYRIGDTEGFVNMPLSIKGIHFTAFFMEKDDFIKCSFRSKGKFDVNKFARKHFNGGGHRNAAGGRWYDNMENTINRFINLLENYSQNIINSMD